MCGGYTLGLVAQSPESTVVADLSEEELMMGGEADAEASDAQGGEAADDERLDGPGRSARVLP